MDWSGLARILGDDGVVTDGDVLASHQQDWTGRWTGSAGAMALPRDTPQVAGTVRWCRANGVRLVPLGGNTGLVGGAVADPGELLVSTRRLTGVQVDDRAGTLVAGAGETLAAVQRAARDAGWRYAVDFAARDSASIGGTVATNAGGIHVISHGDTRHQVLGMEAVTGVGEIVGDLRGLTKDNTGYHLASLFTGSEGTLGIVTRVCLRLVAPRRDRAVALVGLASVTDAVEVAVGLRRALPSLSAVEMMLDAGMDRVCAHLDLANPLPGARVVLLVEVEGTGSLVDDLAGAIASRGPGARAIGTDTVAVADDPRMIADLWRFREAHTEAISAVGVPHKLDVTVPMAAMAAFVDDVEALVRSERPGARLWIFGHLADGNLHVNVTDLEPDDPIDAAILALVARAGGSISAEHGIGRAKVAMLGLNRRPAELEAFRALRRVFDPDGVCNPAVLVPMTRRPDREAST